MSFLAQILARKREEVQAAKRRISEAALAAAAPADRRYFGAALARPGLSVIAEIKRSSPAKGPLAPGLDLQSTVRAYEKGGAAAISILTDGPHFGGSLADLAAARACCSLPLLRKDFLVDPYQLAEAAHWGADAVLLIAAALPGAQLGEMLASATGLGLAALVEVHDEEELERAITANARIIGINNRNLATLAVDPGTALRLLPMIPAGVLKVAESGISGPEDVAGPARAGADAVLVGEALVRSGDPAGLIRAMREAADGVR